MRVLGTPSGRGMVLIDGAEAGSANYDMTVFQEQTFKSAEGTLEADMDVLSKAFSASKTQLQLRNGDLVNIIVTEFNGMRDASFKVSGPVPGY